MSFSFSDGLETALDRVRDAIGDADENNPLRSDERLEAVLLIAGTTADEPVVNVAAENSAVAMTAFSLANEYRRKPSSFSESGGISVSWADRVKGWDALYRDIRAGKVNPIGGVGGGWGAPVGLTLDDIEPLPVGW